MLAIQPDPERTEDALLDQIKTAIQKEEIKLPAMPDIALKIRQAFKDEQYDVLKIARIIQAESGLAAYVLKVANSPLHRGPIPIKTAKHAICRLGQHTVQSLVLAYTLRNLFESNSAQLQKLLKAQWEHSTNLAAISAILADRCDNFDADQALLGGLLQDIGCLPLLEWLQHNHEADDDLLTGYTTLARHYAATIGELILRNWQFDGELIETVKSRENWQRSSEANVDTADIVTIARHHLYMARGEANACPPITQIPAYHKLPFKALSPDQSLAILEEAKEDIEAVKSLLS